MSDTADARALAFSRSDGYQAGYEAGYVQGTTDGRAQGYTDAKVRAHNAVNTAQVSEASRTKMEAAVRHHVGAL